MALPSSGTITINQIRTELGTTSGSLRQLSAIAGFSSPDAMSEFYGYSNAGYAYPAVPLINRFDFAANSYYSNSGSAVDDLSSYNWNGTFVQGTGNGTPITIDQYTGTFPGYMTIPGDSPQKSIRLNDGLKFGGTQSYTVIVWFKVSSFTSNYPGLVCAEGRSGSNAIGYSWYITNASGFGMFHTRYDGTTGNGTFAGLSWGSGGVPSFAYDTWYMAAIRFDGSTMGVDLYAGGTRYTSTTPNSYSLATDASWGAFLGLRYNNWFNGKIGYYCVYGSPLSSSMLDTIFSSTRGRYGV